MDGHKEEIKQDTPNYLLYESIEEGAKAKRLG